MFRIFDCGGLMATSHQHVDGDIRGSVRVIVNEDTDQKEVVAELLRVAHWIEAEERNVEEALKRKAETGSPF